MSRELFPGVGGSYKRDYPRVMISKPAETGQELAGALHKLISDRTGSCACEAVSGVVCDRHLVDPSATECGWTDGQLRRCHE